MKVLIVQFMKGNMNYGEMESARRLSPHLTVVRTGRETFVSKSNPDPADIQCAREGFTLARKAIEKREMDILILDEINMAIDFGLLPLSDLLELIDSKPGTMELILTGRNARPEILDRADLVTEMVERKHYLPKECRPEKALNVNNQCKLKFA
jgi:cob(I)alamin adenosyltransferase